MKASTTVPIRRRPTGMVYLLALLLFGLSGLPASAIQQIGYQTIIDFDEFAPGTTTVTYGYNNFSVTGGVVQTGSAEFPSHSSPNVLYTTGGIETSSSDGYGLYSTDGWSFIGAYVTPSSAPVTATFYGFPAYPWPSYLPATVTTVGLAANQLLGFTDPNINLFAVSFSSAAPFAIDNLTYGLPDVPPGIPEPATWVLLLVGLGGLGLARSGRKGASLALMRSSVRLRLAPPKLLLR